MLEAIDLPGLLAWLEERAAAPAVLRYAARDLLGPEPIESDPAVAPTGGLASELHGAELLGSDLVTSEQEEPLDALDPAQASLLLEGLLHQVLAPRVEARGVEALERAARRLGYDEPSLAAFLCDTQRITLYRLRGLATLNLPIGATRAEIKATHRTLVKVFHPDRHPGAAPDTQASAGRMLARLNEARAVLLRPFEDELLAGEDDLWLDDPLFEGEDGPGENGTADARMLGLP